MEVYITDVKSNLRVIARIEPMSYRIPKALIQSGRFGRREWDTIEDNAPHLFQLSYNGSILGMLWIYVYGYPGHYEIHKLELSADYIGKGKQFDGIAGALIAYACHKAVQEIGASDMLLLPKKSKVKKAFKKNYGFKEWEDCSLLLALSPAKGQRLIEKYLCLND